ncbi:GGDEF domain-containing protein [Psychrobacillus sp. NEAU-3TGS]|uniref:GGDEF domain-containing protein n=1 Tax=Psychrobacillus sp. NEAU-3TGS TaxID=2995412 RepID=UPI002498AAF2|nr:GGDEF domain-containing protein [Psychrobacillus sp. NEAU-3TGS]MDI2589532.1 GGDEF domain-containing protein [Psychrobacillus sp. NEAU-3TGS]
MAIEDHDYGELFSYILKERAIQTVFQPIISLHSGQIYGYEALSRGPANTVLHNPEMLFDYALKNGQLWELENLCRANALKCAHDLKAEGKLFLNVNPNIMNDSKFKQGFTKEYLSKFHMDADSIVFEITEREAINNLKDFISTIDHYKNQYYQIAVDDVGAGYSGLNVITDVRPHYMKLDMKLIRDIDRDRTKQLLVSSLSEFANYSQINIIAEGIETKDELRTLIDIGVHFGQGYFIQKPATQLYPVREEVKTIIKAEVSRKNRVSRNRLTDTSIEQIATPLKTIPSQMPISKVSNLMEANDLLPGFCIQDDNKLIGVITRNKLHLKFSGPYGYSLYNKKPIAAIMSRNYMKVDAETPIDVVAKIAMKRDPLHLYDFITVTKDDQYFGVVTVKDLLEKSMQLEIDYAKHLNPLSELPGNLMIEQQLQSCMDADTNMTVLYFDIDNFKPYNDVYGFEKGDKVIMHLAEIIENSCPLDGFVGHIGGDDFLLITAASKSKQLCEKIIEEFDKSVEQFYHTQDFLKGYIMSKNRHGIEESFPLLTISIAGVSNKNTQSIYELSELASQIKKQCKQIPGSNYLLQEPNAVVTMKG